MIMDTSSPANIAQQQSPAYALMRRGKRGAAALIAADCCNVAAAAAAACQELQQDDGETTTTTAALVRCTLLDSMLDVLLNPYDAISEWNNLDWLRWLMAGGKTLDEFNSAVKDYDESTCCGLVWTANYVAYRCRTCSISPCMSLCGDCFKRGDHTGHDFNMFRSQAGGACDCGDTSVMKPEGFCRKHSSTNNVDDNTTGSSSSSCKQPPADLLRVAERIMPRLLLRLVQYLRENSKMADSRTTTNTPGSVSGAAIANQQNILLLDLEPFLAMLHELSALGAAMRRVMTVSLTNGNIYRWACDYYNSNAVNISGNDSNFQEHQQQQQTIYTIYTDKVRRYYAEAIHQYTTSSSPTSRRHRSDRMSIGSGEAINSNNSSPDEDDDDDEDDDEFSHDEWHVDGQNSRSGIKNKLNHSSFLQEIVFWTVRYEFPQKMVCFLLHMLPDAAYKEALTEAFVMHYGCVARVLATTRDSDTLSNHIVHISVQLFSNEALATRMVDKLGLLRVMVTSLRRMMTKILIPSTLHDSTKNRHRVVDCSKAVMKEHCYWPLVSDLNNVLSHRPIAVKFMCDERLLDSWFSYLSMFQGMNVNCRELGHHVEFEPNTYYAAFSAELEASAYPMWAMLSHLNSADTWPLASRVLRACLHRLRKWLIDVGYYFDQSQISVKGGSASSTDNNQHTSTAIIRRSDDRHQFTFHLPLHRYLAVFLCQAVRAQGACIKDVIPYNNTGNRDTLLLAIAAHPVRAQAAFYEIMQGAWVRNGLQIKGQAMTYIQSNFCISMVDADIYLLQLCLSELSNANIFMSLILEKFKTYDWMRLFKHDGLPQVMDSVEYDAASNMESLLVFLATLVGVRTNLCSDENYDYCQSQLEMVTLLCVSDKTHSQLMELMPERCGSGIQTTSTTSTVTSGEGPSQTLPPLDQKLPLSQRDFETVLQAVAEYKKPQFEASGNMQQGLYVPLAHVWRNLYDPVHVLLRAVHRRDFQSSMDRYTTFMRSIGLLRQNQTPWPPYRTPQQHHPAYRDPRRALLSRLFHAVAWHCLYRAATYHDVSEHTLSLLIYLLDQAWICYKDTSVNDLTTHNLHQQPIDTKDPVYKQFISVCAECNKKTIRNVKSKYDTGDKICPKRRIKITASEAACSDSDKTIKDQDTTLLLDRWYDRDDLVHNMCTTISDVELPPPFFHYYFGNSDEFNTVPSSISPTNLFDYFTSSVAAASTVPTTDTLNKDTVNIQQQSNVPTLASIASNVPIASPRTSQPITVNARPPFYSLNAAAAATSSTMDSALNCVKQRLQFLRPPQPKIHQQQETSTLSLEHQEALSNVDINATGHCPHMCHFSEDDEMLETVMIGGIAYRVDHNEDISMLADKSNPLIPINESIISLLLRLHSHLSGKTDSYQPPSIIPATTSEVNDDVASSNKFASISVPSNDHQDEIICGDGAYYVGRLLDRIAKGSTSCNECIVRTRLSLWPRAVVMRETATREDEEREHRERKRRARDKQQQMMEEMARAQKAFLESARRSGDLVSTDTQSPLTSNSSINTSTNMECDELNLMDTTTASTSCDPTTSSLPNLVIDMDENSSSSSTTTVRDTAVSVRGSHQHQTTQTVDCVICNQTVAVQMEQQHRDPVGLVILVQGTNVLAHRRHLPTYSTTEKKFYSVNSSGTSQNHQQDQIELTSAGSNYYHYWPALPPMQSQHSYHQQSTPIDVNSDIHQHIQSFVDDEDLTTYASHSDRRKRLVSQYFDNMDKADLEIGALTTTTSAFPIGGNVHVQTCGHHLHLRCWSSYLASLKGAQRFNSDKGEYSCPLCRQLANSLMPLMPAVAINLNEQQIHSGSSNTMTSVVMSKAVNKLTELIKQQIVTQASPNSDDKLPNFNTGDQHQQSSLLHSSIFHTVQHRVLSDHGVSDGVEDSVSDIEIAREDKIETGEDPLLDAVNRCVSDMITTTVITAAAQTLPLPITLLTTAERDKLYKVRWHSVVSVAWTNLQIELVQRNNSLLKQKLQNNCSTGTTSNNADANNYYNMLPKRNCTAPLLKVLGESARSLMRKYQTPNCNTLSDIWYKLIGVELHQEQLYSTNPPLLMRDPASLLLQLVLLLPTLEHDIFDTLIQLTYNMQLYVAALKIAITWKQSYNRLRHGPQDLRKPRKCSISNEESHTSKSGFTKLNLDNIDMPSSSSMDITENEDMSPQQLTSLPPLFSHAVAFTKSMLFLTQDDDSVVDIDGMMDDEDEFRMHLDDNSSSENRADISVSSQEDNEENMLLLESYGRQCTLPFLRFAALLKKYVNGDDDSNLDVHHELKTLSPQQNNFKMEQQKQREQLSDCQKRGSDHHQHRKRLMPSVEEKTNEKDSTNSPHCCCNLCHHWSRDDYEFITLTRYLKLLNNNEYEKEIYDICDCCKDNYHCSGNDDDIHCDFNIKQHSSMHLPSAMEAVIWPQWSYSTSNYSDNVSTTISRSWLTSFRKALTTKLKRSTIINENASIDSTVVTDINPNSNDTTATNIIMSARMLLSVDCCKFSGIANSSHNTSDSIVPANIRCSFPTVNWTGPWLLRLPHLYDDVFQYYHGRKCQRCHSVPRETSVCLVCGSVVCLKDNCCKTKGICEAVQHSLECGGGTGMFLVVTSSSVVVIRGKRACLWGSVYLDAFGEEDRELKRGKPLYLSAERYSLLERQWLAHRFDHTNKKWVWHRDAL